MRQKLALCVVAALALGAILYGEYRRADVEVSSAPIFHLVGDTEQELTRLPVALTRLSDGEEIRIGNTLANNYAFEWQDELKKSAENREAQAYVQEVGRRVAVHARRKLPYQFHYIPETYFVNAFALPGGHVFIGQGLLQLMDSEDQLAAVLGHELEHVDLGHCAERVQLEAQLRRLHLGELGELASIPYEIFAAGYRKEQEFAADRDGTQLAVAAGYSPMGAVRMFQTFAQFEPRRRKAETPEQELSTVALQSLHEYFRSHPPSDEREDRIEQLIADQKWPAKAERDLRIGYIGINTRAQSALARYDYAQAKALALRSLALKPAQVAPLEIAYSASLYTGDFASAADAARKLLAVRPNEISHAHRLAEALAAQRLGRQAAEEFAEATPRVPQSADYKLQLDTELAGLRLLAGDEGPIKQIAARVEITGHISQQIDSSPKIAGLVLGRIGHWYYLSGKYDEALSKLNTARELYPASPDIPLGIGWAALQSNKIQTAESSFSASPSPDAQAGLAVTMWRADEKEAALTHEVGLAADSRWKNERWVTPPMVQLSFKHSTQSRPNGGAGSPRISEPLFAGRYVERTALRRARSCLTSHNPYARRPDESVTGQLPPCPLVLQSLAPIWRCKPMLRC
jgi:predicted Zn-dependent protease